MTQAQRRSGARIFVSHSHCDLEKVRPIRNELERRGPFGIARSRGPSLEFRVYAVRRGRGVFASVVRLTVELPAFPRSGALRWNSD